MAPKRKATGPTPLGCICDQDVFVLFLVFTPKCEGKIRTKGGFCAPKRENVSSSKNRAPKESNRTDATGVHFQRRLLFFFLFFSPKCEGKIRVKGGFYAPKAKIVPEKKATGPTPRRCICDKDLFSGLPPRIYFLPHQNFLCPPPP